MKEKSLKKKTIKLLTDKVLLRMFCKIQMI